MYEEYFGNKFNFWNNNSPKSTAFRTDQARDNITIVKISTTSNTVFTTTKNYVSFTTLQAFSPVIHFRLYLRVTFLARFCQWHL